MKRTAKLLGERPDEFLGEWPAEWLAKKAG